MNKNYLSPEEFTKKYGFHEENYFLSNFFPCKIKIGDLTFTNSEAAFHSFKDLSRQKEFEKLDAGDSKRLGRKVNLREDWDEVKDSIMEIILIEKFKQNERLKEKLLKTDAILTEWNYWHDNYWGVCKCIECQDIIGQNKLGKILMKIKGNLGGLYDKTN